MDRQRLIATKLQHPQVRQRRVARPRLVEILERASEHRLTLVCAAAGAGKTTLLSEWQMQTGLPVGWVSLDKEDNDPVRFWTYVCAALDRLALGVDRPLLDILHGQLPQVGSEEMFLATLVDGLLAIGQGVALVLDDYHLIETEAIQRDVAKLLEYLPAHIHLILATRSEPALPLARLRARGQLLALYTTDLCFQADEVRTFLKDVMELDLTEEHIHALEEHTEGWIAGLQLTALSVQRQRDPSDFIATFSGGHRYILEYLTNEVVGQQPEAVKTFLLQTAILERFSVELCNAVTERGDGRVMIERLYAGNLFLIALDEEDRMYRYHLLFAEFLRNQLKQRYPNLIATLHQRASRWYETQGMDMEAIDHALAADDTVRAALLIEQRLETIWQRGEVHTLQKWFEQMPASAFEARPRLALYQILLWNRNHRERGEIERQVRRVEEVMQVKGCEGLMIEPAQMQKLQGELCVVKAVLALAAGERERTIEQCTRALSLLAQKSPWYGPILAHLGTAYFFQDNDEAAQRYCTESIAVSEAIQDMQTKLQAQSIVISALHRGGQLHKAVGSVEQVLRQVPQNCTAISLYYIILSAIHYEWNRLDQARMYADMCIECGKRMDNSHLIWQGTLHRARIRYASGEREEALAQFPQLDQMVRGVVRERVMVSTVSFQVPMWLEQGYEDVALRLIEEHFPKVWNQETFCYLSIAETWTRVYLYQNRLDEALRILDAALVYVTGKNWLVHRVPMLALKALIVAAQGNTTQALEILLQGLLLAQAEGYVRSFLTNGQRMVRLLTSLLFAVPREKRAVVPYIEQLLEAAGEQPRRKEVRAVLSKREQDVLRLIASGCSDKEVAQRLVIVESTVASHLKRIYVKLDVHSRTQAIVKAQAMEIL